jgi:ribose 5-phosphate isomerase B
MRIFIGSDHAGFEYKSEIIKFLQELNHEIIDCGTHNNNSCDYPDYAHKTAHLVNETSDFGILICGSANGVAMTANKYPNVRAALCWESEISKLSRQHNDANIVCVPARFVSLDLAKSIVSDFLNTEFEGGRHQKRVDKIKIINNI